MYEPPPTLPPQLGKWLASRDPALIAKAEAALRDVEPEANDLLLARIKQQQKQMLYAYFGSQAVAQIAFQASTRHHSDNIVHLGVGVATMVFVLSLMIYVSVRPMGHQYNALLFALARRGDLRAVPFLLQMGQFRVQNSTQNEIAETLVHLLRNAPPGNVVFSNHPQTKDPAVVLRSKYSSLVGRSGMNPVFFRSKATATPDRVALWLTLLPHLAADSHRKSRDVLRRIAEAHAQTLDEELIKNTARTLLNGNTPPTATDTSQAERWNTTAGSESPTLLQRLRRP